MAAYTKNTPGKPQGGIYALGDLIIDSVGVVWECVNPGYAVGSFGTTGQAEFIAAPPVSATGPMSSTSSLGTVAGTGVSLVEFSSGLVRRTRFTFTAIALTIDNDAGATLQASGIKIYDYPEGRILVLGAALTLAATTTSILANTLNTGSTCKMAMGTTIGTNSSMATTEVDHLPATSITSSATINVAGAVASAALAAAAQFDGTSTAKDLYLNFAVPTDGDLDADATITLTGTADLVWILLADY